jgi:hypothetical protein
MPDHTLTIPQHADPIARGLLFVLVAAVLGMAVAMPAPATQASAPIVVFATPALAARLDPSAASAPTPTLALVPTEAPTEAPAAPPVAQGEAPALELPAPETAVSDTPALEQAEPLAGGAPAQDAPVDAASNHPLLAIGPQIPEGAQAIHQQPDSTYITVGDSPVRYYVDASGQVTEVRLPGVDTAANGADIAALARATATPSAEPSAEPVAVPTSPHGYLPRAGYRPKKP